MAEQTPSVSVTIDGLKVSVPKDTLLVEAAKQVKNEIPVYCYHTKLGPAGLCRICLVEIEGMPKLQIGCNTRVSDGMVVHTRSPRVNDGRRAVLEFFLLNHPLDCPICDKGGECDLQDFSMAYGQGASRLADPKATKPKAVDLGPTIVLDEERCIVCQRCVRFDDIITGEKALVVKGRGHRDIIATATDEPYHSNFSGNVTELCPVGALTSKTYRFRSRPWDLQRTQTSCTQCSVGCQLSVDVREGSVLRTMSVPADDRISDGWLCDRGRYNIGFYDDERRLTVPLYRENGDWLQLQWQDAVELWAQALKDALAGGGPQTVGVLGGGRLLNEEAFALQHVFRRLGVRNLDWRGGRQRQATPGRSGGLPADLEAAEAVVVVGQSLAETAPILDLRVRKAVLQREAVCIAVNMLDPSPPYACKSVGSVREAVAAVPERAQRVALIWDGVDPQVGRELAGAFPGRASVRAYIAGEQANARGAEMVGMHPALGPGFDFSAQPGRDFAGMVDDARAGKLHVLCVLGANPALHFPDGHAIREALDRTPFVLVSDLFLTHSAQRANLVLPAHGPFEKTGTTTNVAGDLLPVNAARNAPAGTRSDLDMIAALAEALGVELPSAEELGERVIECAAARPDFALGDERLCASLEAQSAAGRDDEQTVRVVVQSRIFAGGGTVAHDAWIEELRPLPEAAVAPAVAQRLGIATGDCVDLESGGATMHDLLVEVRTTLPDDVVAIIGGLPDNPANVFAAGARARISNVRRSGELAGAVT